jgi:hypothetical protein
MAQILHSVLVPSRTLEPEAEELSFDLPVNPLTAVILSLRALNSTATITDYAAEAQQIMSKISRVTVRYRGATIKDGDPVDLAMVDGGLSGWWPLQGGMSSSNGDARSITWPVLFGRRPYDPTECFPATRRGDLVLTVNTADDPTGLTDYTLQVETIELLDAVPERFVKVTTIEQTFDAVGPHTVDLPIGNKLLGLLLRAATFPSAVSLESSFGEVALEVDNVEVLYSRALWRGLHSLWRRRTNTDWLRQGHVHTENTAGTYAQNARTLAAEENLDLMLRYGYVEMDPLGDLSYALNTRDAADVTLEVQSEVEDEDASRVLPIEYVETGASPTGGGGA